MIITKACSRGCKMRRYKILIYKYILRPRASRYVRNGISHSAKRSKVTLNINSCRHNPADFLNELNNDGVKIKFRTARERVSAFEKLMEIYVKLARCSAVPFGPTVRRELYEQRRHEKNVVVVVAASRPASANSRPEFSGDIYIRARDSRPTSHR